MSLNEKLYKVRTELGPVAKKVQAYKYKYADLGACHDAIDPILEAHRLVWVTRPHCTADGRAGVDYELIDLDSTDRIEGSLYLPMADGDPQKAGSAITYARRYALAAIGLLTDEDDDGAKATKPRRANPKAEAAKYINENEKAEIIAKCRSIADSMHPNNAEMADGYMKQIGVELVKHFDVPALGQIPTGTADKVLHWLDGYSK